MKSSCKRLIKNSEELTSFDDDFRWLCENCTDYSCSLNQRYQAEGFPSEVDYTAIIVQEQVTHQIHGVIPEDFQIADVIDKQ